MTTLQTLYARRRDMCDQIRAERWVREQDRLTRKLAEIDREIRNLEVRS